MTPIEQIAKAAAEIDRVQASIDGIYAALRDVQRLLRSAAEQVAGIPPRPKKPTKP